MDLESRAYSVLVVSASKSFNTSLFKLLPESSYYPVHTSSSIIAAQRAFAEREYDFVIINSPLPDGGGTRFAIDTCKSKNCAVLIITRSDLHEEIQDKVFRHGVFTLAKPTSKPIVITALGWMASTRERLRSFEKKTLSIEAKMEEIRIVNRAKWILISELNMDEQDAHRYIEKQAMDRCISKRDVAKDIIKTYL